MPFLAKTARAFPEAFASYMQRAVMVRHLPHLPCQECIAERDMPAESFLRQKATWEGPRGSSRLLPHAHGRAWVGDGLELRVVGGRRSAHL
jgi:hypothetical protein